MDRHRKRLREPELARGLNTAQRPTKLLPGESPACMNVDFDGGSVKRAGGALKFGNHTAPRPGLLVGTDGRGARIEALPSKSVPLRGATYIPYLEVQDIGGRWSGVNTASGLAAPHNVVWHTQRGGDFEIEIGFRLPEETRVFDRFSRASLNTAAPSSAWNTTLGANPALDQFIAIVQKGGDRLTPMSWAIGLVNTANLFDLELYPDGTNIFGVDALAHQARTSDLALCFMWLDAPQFGISRPVQCRYHLTSGSPIYSDESTHVASSNGAYSTLAYRAVIVPFFVEAGIDYHVAVRLSLDSGSPGTGAEPGVTGSAPAWNGDGWLEVLAGEKYGATQSFSSARGEVLRYKGPADSIEYLCKYGVRWWGRDAMFLGLNHRFAPWASGGFIPFGIDSAPAENGGFQVTDYSVHGAASVRFAERARPEEELSATNSATAQLYDLRIAHDPAKDPTGTIFELNQRGFVRHSGAAGVKWGAQTGVWSGIAVQGKNPWAPSGVEWAGLGGLTATPNSGFNPEALRGYRVIFGASTTFGFSANNAAGAMLSIKSYALADAYAAPTFVGQSFVVEGFDGFATGSHPTINGTNCFALVRAFAWDQQPVVVSDLRIFSKPRATVSALDCDLDRDNDESLENLVGHWALDDGGEMVLVDSVMSNHGFLMPIGTTTLERSTIGKQSLFISGEGEALQLDLSRNPDFMAQVRAAMRDGKSGFAVQLTLRETEAYYGLGRREPTVSGVYIDPTNYRVGHRFAPTILAWDVAVPDRKSADGAAVLDTQIDAVDGARVRPQPLLELSHAIESESNVATVGSLYPMGFSLRVPSERDHVNWTAGVPGGGASGLHAWYNDGTEGVSRWDRLAPWVGRSVTLQVGFHPTGTADEFKVYVAAWPKQFLLPISGEPAGAEFAYWVTQTFRKRDLERSVITIGGAWNPKRDEYFDPTVSANGQWQSQGRSIWEACARMVLESVTVFPVSTPGALPTASGGVVAAGTGKIAGAAALPLRELAADDIAVPLAAGGVALSSGAFSLSAPSGVNFPTESAEASARALLRGLVAIDSDQLERPERNSVPTELPRSYFVTGVSAGQLALNRPYVGASRTGAIARAFRAAAATSFSDDLRDRPVICGSGSGYQMDTATTAKAILTADLFANPAPLGVDWRLRIFSPLSGVSNQELWPQWVRGTKRGRANPVRGLYGSNQTLLAGARGSVFEVDDRWRGAALAVLARRGALVESLPRQEDRVLFPASAANLLSIVQAMPIRLAFLTARVLLEGVAGTRTIAWRGSGADPSVIGETQWWLSISNGHPQLTIQAFESTSSGSPPADGMFVARATQSVAAGVETHIRWGLELDASGRSLQRPLCWINGKRVEVVVDAIGPTPRYGPDPWISWLTVCDPESAILVAGAARASQLVPEQVAMPTTVSSAAAYPLKGQRIQGFLHALGGDLIEFRISDAPPGYDNFNPDTFTGLPGERDVVRLLFPGVGAYVPDQLAEHPGVLVSSPFLSLSHEMGRGDRAWSWAENEGEIYCANGGRVGVVEDDGT